MLRSWIWGTVRSIGKIGKEMAIGRKVLIFFLVVAVIISQWPGHFLSAYSEIYKYKKAELSQRWPRDVPTPNMSALKIVGSPWWLCQRLLFPEIFNGRFFWLMLWICVQNLKFVALPVPGIIGDTPKIGAVPGYAHAPLLLPLLMDFCSGGPSDMYLPNLKSRASPVPEIIGLSKKLGNP